MFFSFKFVIRWMASSSGMTSSFNHKLTNPLGNHLCLSRVWPPKKERKSRLDSDNTYTSRKNGIENRTSDQLTFNRLTWSAAFEGWSFRFRSPSIRSPCPASMVLALAWSPVTSFGTVGLVFPMRPLLTCCFSQTYHTAHWWWWTCLITRTTHKTQIESSARL